MAREAIKRGPDGDTTMREVEIHPAHIWTCERCGQDNFERGVTVEFGSQEEYAQACQDLGIYDPEIEDDPPKGAIMSAPEVVECRYCEARFRTVDSRSGD